MKSEIEKAMEQIVQSQQKELTSLETAYPIVLIFAAGYLILSIDP